ncbi:MAG: hypothetical protein E7439_05010 [Ruminococcaceae bacterium]|nr:hypothetical protein [Oscillospiraceae bacterium]
MNRTQKFIRSTMATGLYQLVLMLTGFILPKVMLSFYGSDVNGLVTSITQFINYITLVEAGLSGAAVYALYKPLAANDTQAISRVVVATKKFYAKSGWIFAALVGLLAVVYPFIVETDSVSMPGVAVLVLVIGVSGIMDFFVLGKYRAILTADQKQYVISLALLLYCVLNTVMIVLFSALGFSVVFARIAALVAVFAKTWILAAYCKKHYGYLDYSAKPDDKALNKRWDALFLQILGTVQTGAPVVLSTVLTSLSSVSIYSVYNMVVNGLNSVLGIFGTGLGAGFGDLIVRKETKKLQKAYLDFEVAYYALITLIYAVAMVQILPFVLIYTRGVTDADYHQPLLGFLFTLNGFLYNIKTPQGMLVISAGLYKETRWQTTAQALIAVIGGVVLGYLYGLAGIMIAMCASNLYRAVDLLFFIPKHVTKLKMAVSLKNVALSVAELIIVVGLGLLIPWDNGSFLLWAANSAALVVIGVVIIGTGNFLVNREQVASVLTRAKQMLKK